jgi:hypothetical protein
MVAIQLCGGTRRDRMLGLIAYHEGVDHLKNKDYNSPIGVRQFPLRT